MRSSILVTILCLCFSCGCYVGEKSTAQTLTESSVSPAQAPTSEKIGLSENVVYAVLLENFAYSSDEPGNWIIVQKETITPSNFPEVESLKGVDELLLRDFIENNETKEKLPDGYDVKFALEIMQPKGTLESFFRTQDARKKNEHSIFKLKSVVRLSRVGFNADNSLSLVYVEHYSPAKQLQKKYCLISWEKSGEGAMKKEVKWLNAAHENL